MTRRTLVTLGIALTVVAFVAAEADFWGDHHFGRYDHFHSNILTSFRVSHRGEIELDEAETGIVAMSPGASLEVSERRFLTRRRLEVRADASGRPRYELEVGSRQRSEAEAKAFLTAVLPEVVRSTTIGARARARRLLETKGLDTLLREVSLLDSNSARRIYIEEAVTFEGLTEEQALRVVRTAGREINSSSRLRSSLVYLAEELPDDWALTGDLAMAAENIAASSEKAAALVEIVRLRGLDVDGARAVADALDTIAASSEKSRAIIRVARLEPAPDVVEQLLEPIDSIESSSERRRALEDLVSYPGLAESSYARALDLGGEIASSSEKASFLSALADVQPFDEELQQRYVEVASSIAASSERSRALVALLRSTDLPASSCSAWIRAAGDVAASSVSASLLVESAVRCPNERRVWRAYLAAARRISASSEQRRVLMALLEREDLDFTIIEEISAVAEGSIAAASERQLVIDRALEALSAPAPAEDPEEVTVESEPEARAEPEAETETEG